jgi:hypothetical protein
MIYGIKMINGIFGSYPKNPNNPINHGSNYLNISILFDTECCPSVMCRI